MKINYLQDSEKYQDTASQIGCKSPLRVSYLTTKEKHIIVNCWTRGWDVIVQSDRRGKCSSEKDCCR